MSWECYSVGCTSHNPCPCNSQCTCNTDARTCAAQRATSTGRVFSWTRNPVNNTITITADDINQLRTFLQQEQNSRSSDSPSNNTATTYPHPGSCSIQTTSWTGNTSTFILRTSFNQLVTLLNTLKTRATGQGASITASDATTITEDSTIQVSHTTMLRNILIESYQQCICNSKLVCTCHTLCSCNTRCATQCSCNATHCSCRATCSCYWYW